MCDNNEVSSQRQTTQQHYTRTGQLRDSNPRHSVVQASALPTELPGKLSWYIGVRIYNTTAHLKPLCYGTVYSSLSMQEPTGVIKPPKTPNSQPLDHACSINDVCKGKQHNYTLYSICVHNIIYCLLTMVIHVFVVYIITLTVVSPVVKSLEMY